MIDLYVRFGIAEDGAREVRKFSFASEALMQAFIDGMWELSTHSDGSYDITRKLDNGMFEPDPEWDESEDEDA